MTRTGRQKRRVALFMPYDYLAISTSVINAARVWSRHDFGVDIYAPSFERFGAPDFGDEDVVVRHVPRVRVRGLPQLSYPYAAARAAWRSSYAITVGFDQGGLMAASAISMRHHCPCVYHSLELTLAEHAHGFHGALNRLVDKVCARRAALVVTQDAERATLLSRDLGLPASRTMVVPNTPLGAYSGPRTDYLREKFGIPATSRVVLLSGSLIHEHLALDVIESAASWPEGFVLAVHGWAPIPEYRAAILEAAARLPGRVHVSFDVLPSELVDVLYASADVGLAVYRPIDSNFAYIGAAAGKVFGYMRVGTPTIASDLPGMREIVVETHSGELVNDVSELPSRLLQIDESFDDYSRAARDTFTRYDYALHYARVISRLTGLSARR